MLNLSPQQTRILLSGCALLTGVLCLLPFAGYDPVTVNYTGLFQASPVRTWLCMGPALILETILFLAAAKRRLPSSKYPLPSFFLLVLVIGLMVMPYRKEHDLSTNVHLILAFGTLVLLNVLVVRILAVTPKILMFYAAGSLLAFFTALTASSINGLSELIYAAVLTAALRAAAEPPVHRN